jgi:hypothetical protein
MKALVLLAVLIGVLCITYSAATPYASNQEDQLISSLAQQLSSQDSAVNVQEQDDDNDDTALAQVYLHLLENEVQKQDMSDDDRAEMESIFSKLKRKFTNFRNKIKGGFRNIKNKIKGGFRKFRNAFHHG